MNVDLISVIPATAANNGAANGAANVTASSGKGAASASGVQGAASDGKLPVFAQIVKEFLQRQGVSAGTSAGAEVEPAVTLPGTPAGKAVKKAGGETQDTGANHALEIPLRTDAAALLAGTIAIPVAVGAAPCMAQGKAGAAVKTAAGEDAVAASASGGMGEMTEKLLQQSGESTTAKPAAGKENVVAEISAEIGKAVQELAANAKTESPAKEIVNDGTTGAAPVRSGVGAQEPAPQGSPKMMAKPSARADSPVAAVPEETGKATKEAALQASWTGNVPVSRQAAAASLQSLPETKGSSAAGEADGVLASMRELAAGATLRMVVDAEPAERAGQNQVERTEKLQGVAEGSAAAKPAQAPSAAIAPLVQAAGGGKEWAARVPEHVTFQADAGGNRDEVVKEAGAAGGRAEVGKDTAGTSRMQFAPHPDLSLPGAAEEKVNGATGFAARPGLGVEARREAPAVEVSAEARKGGSDGSAEQRHAGENVDAKAKAPNGTAQEATALPQALAAADAAKVAKPAGMNDGAAVVPMNSNPADAPRPVEPAPRNAAHETRLTGTADAPGQADGVRQVNDAQLMERAGRAEMRIAFETDKLGAVELRARMTGEQVGAAIIVERRDAHAMLAADLPVLQQALSERQLRVEQVTLQQGAVGGGPGDGGAQSQQGERGNARLPAPAWPGANGRSPNAEWMPENAGAGVFDDRGRLSVRV